VAIAMLTSSSSATIRVSDNGGSSLMSKKPRLVVSWLMARLPPVSSQRKISL